MQFSRWNLLEPVFTSESDNGKMGKWKEKSGSRT